MSRVNNELYWSIDSEVRRLKEEMDRDGENAEKLLHHLREANEKRFIGDVIPMVPFLRFRTKGVELVNGLAYAPEVQVKNVRQWNIAYDWGFTEDDFRKLPDSPTNPKAVTVLVPYLDSPLATVQGLLCALETLVPLEIHYGVKRSLKPERFNLIAESLPRGLRWETIRLDAPMPEPKLYWECVKHLPHAGVLVAMLQCPGWLLQLAEHKMPHARFPHTG